MRRSKAEKVTAEVLEGLLIAGGVSGAFLSLFPLRSGEYGDAGVVFLSILGISVGVGVGVALRVGAYVLTCMYVRHFENKGGM